ncbi:MAG: putative glycosyltransferase CsbB [candidate division WS2 bacterium]|nr:putative glycosyltransferase CsbB [Candidatus Psychracetigena formicireducens]
MNKKPYLSVIIPAYNETKRIPLTLIDIDKRLSKVKYSYEILVVSDGSTDGTAEATKRLGSIIKNLRLIDNKENRGKGAVVKQGMLEAEGDYRLFTDADNSTAIDQFDKMIPYFKDGYHVVIGSRDVEGAQLHPPQPWYKRLLGNIGNIIIQALLIPGVWDTQCGFKCFSKEASLKIFPLQRINGWGFDVEILSLAKAFGYEIKEIPVVWIADARSKVSFKAYLQVFMETFNIRLWLWRDVYNIKPKKRS